MAVESLVPTRLARSRVLHSLPILHLIIVNLLEIVLVAIHICPSCISLFLMAIILDCGVIGVKCISRSSR